MKPDVSAVLVALYPHENDLLLGEEFLKSLRRESRIEKGSRKLWHRIDAKTGEHTGSFKPGEEPGPGHYVYAPSPAHARDNLHREMSHLHKLYGLKGGLPGWMGKHKPTTPVPRKDLRGSTSHPTIDDPQNPLPGEKDQEEPFKLSAHDEPIRHEKNPDGGYAVKHGKDHVGYTRTRKEAQQVEKEFRQHQDTYPAHEARKWAESTGAHPKITTAQHETLGRYTLKDEGEVNHYIHTGKSGDKPGMRQCIRHMDNAMAANRTDRDMHVYRVTDSPGLAAKFDKNPKSLVGTTVHHPGYQSTTHAPEHLIRKWYDHDKGHVVFKVHVPKGTPAIAMHNHSALPNQGEILLHRGHTMRIKSAKVNALGHREVEVHLEPHKPEQKVSKAVTTVRSHTSHSKTGKVERVRQHSMKYKEAAPKLVATVKPARVKIPAGSPHPTNPEEWKPSEVEHREVVKQQDPHKFVPPSSWNLRVHSLGHEPDQGKWTPGLLATYRDQFGKKQSVYSKQQRANKDAAKFEKVRGMSKDLPKLRRQWAKHLSAEGLARDRVAAALMRLVDLTTMRIGEEGNALKEEGEATFGAASLRKEHVTLGRGSVTFSFAGKHHKEWDRTIKDKDIVQVVTELMNLPGPRLWQYEDGGKIKQMTANGVRDYMATLGSYTPKDLRTYQATKMAAESLTDVPVPTEPPKGKKDPAEAVIMEHLKKVADRLGNTPAVCKSSYVNPEVLETWKAGKLKPEFWKALYPEHQSDDEAAFARLLDHIAGLIKRGEIPNLTGGTIEKAVDNAASLIEHHLLTGGESHPDEIIGSKKHYKGFITPSGRLTTSFGTHPGAHEGAARRAMQSAGVPTHSHPLGEPHTLDAMEHGFVRVDYHPKTGLGINAHRNMTGAAARAALKMSKTHALNQGDFHYDIEDPDHPDGGMDGHSHAEFQRDVASNKKIEKAGYSLGARREFGSCPGCNTPMQPTGCPGCGYTPGVEKAMPRSEDAVEWQMHRPDTQYRGGTRHREHLQALAENQRVMERLLKKHGSEAAMPRLARLQYHALAKDSDTHRYHISHLPHPPPDSAEEKWLTSRSAVRKAVGEESTGEEEPDWKHSFEDGMDHDTHIRTHEKEWMDLRRELVRAVLDKSPAGKEKRQEIVRKMRECSLHRRDHLLHKHGLSSVRRDPIRPAMKSVVTIGLSQGGSHE